MRKLLFETFVLHVIFVIVASFIFYNPDMAIAQENVEQKSHFTFRTGHKPPYDMILDARFKEAFSRMGLSAEVIALPSQRSLTLSNMNGDGEAARVNNLTKLDPENTTNLIKVPEVSLTLVLSVFTKKLDFPVTGWADLASYTNGARIGAKILEKNIPGKRVFLADNTQLFRMLSTDRLDTVVEWRQAGQQVIKSLDLKDIRVLEPALKTVHFYPFIHKNHKDMAPLLARTLKEMKEDGTFQKIKEDISAGK